MNSSGIRPDLSPEDRDEKRKLAKCLLHAYSELIRSDIPGSSGSKSSQTSTLRPSPPFVMKFSCERLSRKSRSAKRKSQDSLEKSHPTWGKAPRLGTSSSSPSTHVRVKEQILPSSAEVPSSPGAQPRSASATKAKDSSGRAAEPPLEVMPISVWSLPT